MTKSEFSLADEKSLYFQLIQGLIQANPHKYVKGCAKYAAIALIAHASYCRSVELLTPEEDEEFSRHLLKCSGCFEQGLVSAMIFDHLVTLGESTLAEKHTRLERILYFISQNI